jgi:rare lipoprotein A (peptidoglycan hydrolase)
MSDLTTHRRTHVCALLVAVCALFALPSLAWAGGGSGGAGMGGSGASSGSSGGTGAHTAGTGPVSASGDGITLDTNSAQMLRGGLTFSGTAANAAGKTIEIDRLGHQTHWRWTPTATTTVAPDGSFSVTWHTNHIGRFQIRALVAQSGQASAASAAPTLTTTVYRRSLATLYGPGFYGHRTACGQKLGRNTIGVASRVLRCGTKVAVMFHGHTMVVPVIDKGPYANHADWDLTMATGKALGDTGTAWVGAVSLPRQPSTAAPS